MPSLPLVTTFNNFRYEGDGPVVGEYFTTQDPFNGDPDVVTPVGSRTYDYNRLSYFGHSIDHFHRRKNAGELLPHTPYTRLDISGSASGSISINTQYANYETWGDGPYVMFQEAFPAAEVNMVNDLFTDLNIDPVDYVQLAAGRIYSRGWDALTFLGEFHQVLRMFKTFVRKYFLKRVESPKEIFQAWLEGRYGWRILVYDLLEIQDLINNLDETARTRFKDHMGTSGTYSTTETLNEVKGSGTFSVDLTHEWDYGVRGSVIADITPPKVQFNPFVTTWELITFSFVIDWILNVGAALNAISFLVLADKYTASYGRYADLTLTTSSASFVPNPTFSGVFTQESSYSLEYKERVPCSVPYFPQLNSNLNVFKIIDLIALVVTRL